MAQVNVFCWRQMGAKKVVDASLSSFQSVRPRDCSSQCSRTPGGLYKPQGLEFLSHVLDFLVFHEEVFSWNEAGFG